MGMSERSDLAPLAVYEMMRHLGIDTAGGVIPRYGLAFACAARTCRGCAEAKNCRKWLQSASPTQSLAPRFCPNADLLLQLTLDGPNTDPSRPSSAAAPAI